MRFDSYFLGDRIIIDSFQYNGYDTFNLKHDQNNKAFLKSR